MKIQNPTKLDIFFKGGGLIKFPVQNLKQIDIEPIDDEGGGGDDEEEVFFKLLTIQPNAVVLYYNEGEETMKTIDEFTLSDANYYNIFCFSKEEFIKLGFNSEDLDNLQETSAAEIFDNESFSELIPIDNSILENNIILYSIYVNNGIVLNKHTPEGTNLYYLFKVRNDIGIDTYSIIFTEPLG